MVIMDCTGLVGAEAKRAEGRLGMMDVDVPLLTHDNRNLLLRDVSGERGLVAVGVGRAAERGFQMLHRFAASCNELEAAGVNVVFVYPEASARHVQDDLSVMAARYRQKPCLLLDGSGRFFRETLPARLLRAVCFDEHMALCDIALIDMRQANWDPLLRECFMQVVTGRSDERAAERAGAGVAAIRSTFGARDVL